MTAIDPFADVRLKPAQPKAPEQSLGTDTFLKLLVAQLRYQNPLAPKDGTEFLMQTAQFTAVEKLGQLEKLTKEQGATNQALSASALIGRDVSYRRDGESEDRTGRVTAVRFSAGGPVLKVGTEEVPLATVSQIAQPPAAPTT